MSCCWRWRVRLSPLQQQQRRSAPTCWWQQWHSALASECDKGGGVIKEDGETVRQSETGCWLGPVFGGQGLLQWVDTGVHVIIANLAALLCVGLSLLPACLSTFQPT